MDEVTCEVLMEITKLGNRLLQIEQEQKEIEKRTRYLLGWSEKKENPELLK